MKKGYTLSEVLVVLLVLGIVAAFIIPAVMRTAPDRASLLYKKTFYSVQEAAREMIQDNTMYPKNKEINGSSELTKGLFSDYTKTTFCNYLRKTLNTIDLDSSEVTGCNSAGSESKPNFITTNGVKWYGLGGGENFGESLDISVKCSGTVFQIRVYKDGRVGTDDQWDSANKILKDPFNFRE